MAFQSMDEKRDSCLLQQLDRCIEGLPKKMKEAEKLVPLMFMSQEMILKVCP